MSVFGKNAEKRQMSDFGKTDYAESFQKQVSAELAL